MLETTVFTLKPVTSAGKTYPAGSWLGLSEVPKDAKVKAGVTAGSFVICPFDPNKVAINETATAAAITVTVVDANSSTVVQKAAPPPVAPANKLSVAVNGVADLTFSGGTADTAAVLTVTIKVDAAADMVKTVNITVGMTDTALATAVAALTFTGVTLTRAAKKVTVAADTGAITKLTAVIA